MEGPVRCGPSNTPTHVLVCVCVFIGGLGCPPVLSRNGEDPGSGRMAKAVEGKADQSMPTKNGQKPDRDGCCCLLDYLGRSRWLQWLGFSTATSKRKRGTARHYNTQFIRNFYNTPSSSVNNYAVENEGSNYSTQFKDFGELVSITNKGLLGKLSATSESSLETAKSSVKNYTVENGGRNYNIEFKDLGELVRFIDKGILGKLSSTSESSLETAKSREHFLHH
ncbi:hypothetical protein OROMI_016750 [Orobanche minor]